MQAQRQRRQTRSSVRAIDLDYELLGTAETGDAALYLRAVASDNPLSIHAITESLLHGIALDDTTKAVPPNIFSVWASACPDESAIAAGMRYQGSVVVRSSAIWAFGHRFHTAKCEQLWRALGGTQGVVNLMTSFSAKHTSQLCNAIRGCSTSGHAPGKRQKLVTDLLQRLSSALGGSETGQRDLTEQYSKLVCACTPSFRDQWTLNNGYPKRCLVKMFECDITHYEEQFLRLIAEDDSSKDTDFNMYLPLLQKLPGNPSPDDSSATESMAFSVQALQTVHHAKIFQSNGQHADWISSTIHSLVNRIVNRKTSTNFTLEALQAISACLHRNIDNIESSQPMNVQSASYRETRYLRNIMQLWRRDTASYEPALTLLLKDYRFHTDLQPSPSDSIRGRGRGNSIEGQINATKREQRYSLLRWIFRNHPGIRFDIENDSQIQERNDPFLVASDVLPIEFLFALCSEEAVRLFDRFEACCPGKLKLDIGYLNELGEGTMSDVAGLLLRLRLQEDLELASRDGKHGARHSQQAAERSGSPSVRTAWAVAAVHFAVASRSLDLLQEIVIWARRFNGMSAAIRELYGEGRAFEDEFTIQVLSGIPNRISSYSDVLDIRADIRKGNEVILNLLRSAVQAQSEPSFTSDDWESVKLLFRRVVNVRLQSANILQACLRLTDTETFNCIWENTIKTLLEAEKLGLASGNPRLKLRDMNGLQNYGYPPRPKWPPYYASQATLRFIDELAERRDHLWETYRTRKTPAVGASQLPWPRGLPTQALYFPRHIDLRYHVKPGDEIEVQDEPGSMPYIEKRATAVVLMSAGNPLSLLPAEEETRSAIGGFVENYSAALWIYLSLGEEDDPRLKIAWDHALQSFSGSSMSGAEKLKYWTEVFAAAGAQPPPS